MPENTLTTGSDMTRLGTHCIWCEGPTTDSDISHVLPECFGNAGAQVLLRGTVCRSCNNYFGSKIEPALIEDPMIHAICVALRVVDAGDANVFRDRLFDEQHPPVGPPQRNLSLNLTVRDNALELDAAFEVKGGCDDNMSADRLPVSRAPSISSPLSRLSGFNWNQIRSPRRWTRLPRAFDRSGGGPGTENPTVECARLSACPHPASLTSGSLDSWGSVSISRLSCDCLAIGWWSP